MNHLFKIRTLINSANYYASIEIEAHATKVRGLNIEYEDVDPEWYTSIDFGVRFFYQYFNFKEHAGLKIVVKRLHSMLGDTTPLTVFYVTVKCLSEIFNYPDELISLDKETGFYKVSR